MATKTFTAGDVKKIAKLANLPLDESLIPGLQKGVEAILEIVNKLTELDTTGIEPTSQVTGLENIFRDDIVEFSLTQEQALKNSSNTYNGYFVVDAILE